MPEVPRYYRQVTPVPGSAGNIIVARTGGYSKALGDLGEVLANIGQNYAAIEDKARYHNQLNNAKILALRKFSEYETSLLTNPDTETWGPGLDKVIEDIRTSVKFSHPRARDDFGVDFEIDSINHKQRIQEHKIQTDAYNFREDLHLNLDTVEELGGGTSDPKTFEERKVDLMGLVGLEPDEKGNPKPKEEWDNPLLMGLKLRLGIYNQRLEMMTHKYKENQLRNITLGMPPEDALKYTTKVEKDYDADIITSIRSETYQRQRIEEEELIKLQEQTASQFLVKRWSNELTLPEIDDAVLNKHLTTAEGKYLHDSIVNPKPIETTLEGQAKANDIVLAVRNGTMTKREGLSGLISLSKILGPNEGKAAVNDLYADYDKEDSFWEDEAYKTIEKRLMTIDPLSGKLFGSTDQINTTDRAKIRLDNAIKSAAKEKKPLKGTDYLKKAVEISNQLMPKEKMLSFGGQKLPAGEYEEFIIKEEKTPIEIWKSGEIPSKSPIGMESIWDELSDEGKLDAMNLLSTGKYTVEQLIDYYKNWKTKSK